MRERLFLFPPYGVGKIYTTWVIDWVIDRSLSDFLTYNAREHKILDRLNHSTSSPEQRTRLLKDGVIHPDYINHPELFWDSVYLEHNMDRRIEKLTKTLTDRIDLKETVSELNRCDGPPKKSRVETSLDKKVTIKSQPPKLFICRKVLSKKSKG